LERNSLPQNYELQTPHTISDFGRHQPERTISPAYPTAIRVGGRPDDSANCRKRGELPASYFSRLKTAVVPIEKHLLLPEFSDAPAKLLFDEPTFTKFRTERRESIWKLACKIVDPEVT
jgi:hypothetical protein